MTLLNYRQGLLLPNDGAGPKSSILQTARPVKQGKPVKQTSKFGFVGEAMMYEDVYQSQMDCDQTDAKMNLTTLCNTRPYVPDVVQKANERIFAKNLDKEYTTMSGMEDFREAAARLIFSQEILNSLQDRILTVQSMAGTGAVRLVGEFIKRFLQTTPVFLSDPTWNSHQRIFTDLHIPIQQYRFLHSETRTLDFEGMITDLTKAPDNSIILLQSCGHNPTGLDPNDSQWAEIADLCLKKGHLPVFDVTYQGLATGCLNRDAYAPRLFVEKGLEVIVVQSFSKNMGLYADCVGTLSFVVNNAHTAKSILDHLTNLINALHGWLPIHGARIATEILHHSDLLNDWKSDLKSRHQQTELIRQRVCFHLQQHHPDQDWTYLLSQNGIFAYIGLSASQVIALREKHHIYVEKNGQMLLYSISLDKAERLAAAIADVSKNKALYP